MLYYLKQVYRGLLEAFPGFNSTVLLYYLIRKKGANSFLSSQQLAELRATAFETLSDCNQDPYEEEKEEYVEFAVERTEEDDEAAMQRILFSSSGRGTYATSAPPPAQETTPNNNSAMEPAQQLSNSSAYNSLVMAHSLLMNKYASTQSHNTTTQNAADVP